MKLHHRITLAIALSITALLLPGCQAPAPTSRPSFVAASSEDARRIRASYQQQNPAVEVGVVVDTLPSENLAAIGEVDVSKFKPDDVVCFIDASTAPLVCGKVVRVTDDQVHVKYEAPEGARRAPMRGDLGVAFR